MSKEDQISPVPSEEEEDEYITFTIKKTTLLTVFIPVALLIGMGVGYYIWGQGASPPPTVSAADPTGIEQVTQRYDIPINEDDPYIGPEDAPITIVEFSDFECPYCRRYYQETFGQIISTYEGQVRYVFKDFPLTSIHPNAEPAAVAAHCAHEQDAFWDFHNMLFSMQLGLSEEAYLTYASELGLDMEQFSECITEDRYLASVQDEFDWAANLGVRSTPTFFINGIPLIGAQPFEAFVQVIEDELAGNNN